MVFGRGKVGAVEDYIFSVGYFNGRRRTGRKRAVGKTQVFHGRGRSTGYERSGVAFCGDIFKNQGADAVNRGVLAVEKVDFKKDLRFVDYNARKTQVFH